MTLNGGAFPVGWLESGSCRLRYVSSPSCLSAGHRCLGKFLTEGLLGLTSSCCFGDLVRFLVSQKALFLGSCCRLQPCPVITGRQGGLPPVSRGVLRYRAGPRVSPQRQQQGTGREVLKPARSVPDHLNPALAPDGIIPLSCVVCFKWATASFM